MRIVINTETGEVIEREMTAEEIAQEAIDAEATAVKFAEEAEKIAKRAELLERLGISEDEAKILFG